MKLSKYSLSLLAFCLFFNIGAAEAKVCMITDPNCNAPLDFTMPDCDDEVVSKDYPKTEAICGPYQKTAGKKYAYGNCWESCANKTCEDEDIKEKYRYKAGDGGGFDACDRGYEVDPVSKFIHGDCYQFCKKVCSDEYQFTEVPLDCSDGQKEENQSGTGKEKCKRCTGTACEFDYATATTAASCVDGQTLLSQASNAECKKCEGVPCESGYSTGVACPSGTLLSQPSNTACKQCVTCPNGFINNEILFTLFAPAEHRQLLGGLHCVSNFCDKLGFKATAGTCVGRRELKCAFDPNKAFCL